MNNSLVNNIFIRIFYLSKFCLFATFLLLNFSQYCDIQAAEIKPDHRKKFSVENLSISKLEKLFDEDKITCTQVVNTYLNRIKKYNLTISDKAPLNAITEINSYALKQAIELDEKRQQNKKLGKLYCVPIILKDNIDSFETHSSSGSLALLGNQPIADAVLVEKIRKEDAIILAKSAMDEFASGIDGISTRNGRTGNAYDTNQNPGGSSSGSAVALSADFALVSIGTDNSGSIRIPAAFNGVMGLRPSQGLVSQQGIFPRGNIDGTAGPLAKSIPDLALVLDVIKSHDTDKFQLGVSHIKGKKIGVVQNFSSFQTFKSMPVEIKKLFDSFNIKIESLGAEVLPEINLTEFNKDRRLNMAGEKEDIDEYLSSYPSVRKSYSDICLAEKTIVFGTTKECLEFVEGRQKKYSKEYYQALSIIENNKIYVEKIMNENHLDALMLPVSTHGSAIYDGSTLVGEILASNSGLPALTFTIGFTKEGMPVGVELVGKKYREADLLNIAYAYEQSNKQKTNPAMPTPNDKISSFDIQQYNNLISTIGQETFQQVFNGENLNKNPEKKKYEILTPQIFNQVYSDTVKSFINNN